MTKRSRLEPLAGLADAREAEAARGLAAAVRVLEVKRAELARLTSYLEDYRRQAEQTSEARDGAWWQNVRSFMARLNEAVQLQELEVEKLKASHRVATAHWERSHREARILDKLVDAYRLEEAKTRGRREQSELDERAARARK